MNKLPCWYLDKFELGDMPTPDIRGWSPEEIGPILDLDEMTDHEYDAYHGDIPLSPEAEEMLASIAVGAQVEK
jgi:hypothetical protein